MPGTKTNVKRKRWWNSKRILFSPFVLGVLPAVAIIMVLPDLFKKYEIKELGKVPCKEKREYHIDLDGDGGLERITSSKASDKNTLTFVVFKNQTETFDQFYFDKSYDENNADLFFFDIEKDGYTEVFGFTYSQDSVFLNWIQPIDSIGTGKATRHQKFITTISKMDDGSSISWGCNEMHFVDLNGDGHEEWVFPIKAGRSFQPREIFAYDKVHDSLMTTGISGLTMFDLQFIDMDNDQRPEILPSTVAYDNFDSTAIRFSDFYPWLIIFNSGLEVFNNPEKFTSGVGNSVLCKFDPSRPDSVLVTLFSSNLRDNGPALLQIRDRESKILKEFRFPENYGHTISFFQTNDNFICQFSLDTVVIVDKNLNNAYEVRLPMSGVLKTMEDFDENGIMEFVQFSQNGKKMIIYSEMFKIHNQIINEDGFRGGTYLGFKIGKNRLSIRTFYNSCIYVYKSNILYYFRFIFYLIIYLILAFLIWGVKKLQELQTRENLKLQGEVKQLQLSSIKNQLDPHFTFNALNVVRGLSHEGEVEKVDQFVVRFSRLLRKQIESSDLNTVTIKEEIDFVDDFIELQKIRFEKQFTLLKHIASDTLWDFPIPKMLIHTHVENAIKHGLLPKGEGGVINLVIKPQDSGVMISIQDNGIGRHAASRAGTMGSGTGLKVLGKIYRLYYQLYKINIRQEIVDLYGDTGESSGTLINIIIPKPAK